MTSPWQRLHAPRTLRGRIVLTVAVLLIIAIGLVSIVSVVVLRKNLLNQAESSLFQANDSATALLLDGWENDGLLPEDNDSFSAVPPTDEGFIVVLKGTKQIYSLYVDSNYDYRNLTAQELAAVDPEDLDLRSATVPIGGLGDFLVTSQTIDADQEDPYYILTGASLNQVDNVVREYVLWLVLIGLAIGILAAVIGSRVVSSALRPLGRVADVADRVSQTPLSSGEIDQQERVPRDDMHQGSEVDRVAEALNRLLTHVESSLNVRHRTEDSMRRFIAEASHELRNPLASIRGYADFYANDAENSEEVSNALVRIGAEAARMSALVNDLLLLAKLDADPELAHEEVELSRIVLETVSDARFAYPEHTWRLTLPTEGTTMYGDEGSIRQMLLNLVANAGQHTPHGTAVTVDLAESTDEITLAVIDDGPGIPAESVPTIFDRFTQAQDASGQETRERTAVGLGLAIVQALAVAAGYAVTVESDASGSRFTIRIPKAAGRKAAPPPPVVA